jgi:RNA polymerase sigma factor (sigma-70 family)
MSAALPASLDNRKSSVLCARGDSQDPDPVPHSSWNELLDRVLAGDDEAIRRLVDGLSPIIQARVVRVLRRLGGLRQRNVREEVEDLTQEVFATLFASGGRALKAWDRERGVPFPFYVGVIAERHVISLFRSGKRRPWREDATEEARLERKGGGSGAHGPESSLASRQLFDRLLEAMRQALSPLGMRIFELAYVEEREIKEVAEAVGISEDAVYVWRSRLRKLAGELLDGLERTPPPTEVPTRPGVQP